MTMIVMALMLVGGAAARILLARILWNGMKGKDKRDINEEKTNTAWIR
jgi:hypothetical protein